MSQSTVSTVSTGSTNFVTTSIEVTKTVEGKAGKKATRELVGNVTIYIPTLLGLVAGAEVAKDKEGKELLNDDNTPAYTSEVLDWIQSAITAKAKSQARNKLVPKTATLLDGQKIATNWEELTAESVGNGAVHLVLIREIKAKFLVWVASLGKSEKAQKLISDGFLTPESLTTAEAGYKTKFLGYLNDFVVTLSDEDLVKYNKYLTKVTEKATSETIEADDY